MLMLMPVHCILLMSRDGFSTNVFDYAFLDTYAVTY
jgi:hypothetical protein